MFLIYDAIVAPMLDVFVFIRFEFVKLIGLGVSQEFQRLFGYQLMSRGVR